MDELIVSFVKNYPAVATVIAGLIAAHALAAFIVNLTPTPKDDAFVGKAYKVIEYVAGIITEKVKEFPGESELKREVIAYPPPEDQDDEADRV